MLSNKMLGIPFLYSRIKGNTTEISGIMVIAFKLQQVFKMAIFSKKNSGIMPSPHLTPGLHHLSPSEDGCLDSLNN